MWSGNSAFVSRRKTVGDAEAFPFFFTTSIGFQHALHKDAYYFPIQLEDSQMKEIDDGQGYFFASADVQERNKCKG